MEIQRGLLAILNCNEEETRNPSPGGIHKSGQPPPLPRRGSLPLLLAQKETLTHGTGAQGLEAEGGAPDLGLTQWLGGRYPI